MDIETNRNDLLNCIVQRLVGLENIVSTAIDGIELALGQLHARLGVIEQKLSQVFAHPPPPPPVVRLNAESVNHST